MYCNDSNRRRDYLHTSFDFLGYTSRPREMKTQTDKLFTGFNPAISNRAAKQICAEIQNWGLH
ncbi:MAG: hypothetical protein OXM02_12990 [Bacteroidota bacterium]|nr:hypothetical protein [Bacteroidota bacterium]MDE2835416.1 hypothetical protein [Bacteroidota bacterium]